VAYGFHTQNFKNRLSYFVTIDDFETKLVLSITTTTHVIDDELNEDVIINIDKTSIKLKRDEVSNWFYNTKYLKHGGARIAYNPHNQNKILTTWDKINNISKHEIRFEFKNGYITTINLYNVFDKN
jgi:hypothetical protein